jgi:MoaA/NifB/PqqE/SkfB family radical SAM enzyme
MSAFLKSPAAFTRLPAGVIVFDNTKRLARLAYKGRYYVRFARSAVGRIPVSDMLRSHFPFLLADGLRPASVTVEFTNYCNLRCPYCTSPLGLRQRGFMSESTFSRLMEQVRNSGIPRIRITGNGESTLHPRFDEMITELGSACGYLQLVTNGQRLKEPTITSILRAPVRMIEISADAADKAGYERSRIGGNFETLLHNLQALQRLRRELRAPTVINIRVMMRPSQQSDERNIRRFWREYADTVMPQYIVNKSGVDADVFRHHQRQFDVYPRCTLPSTTMDILWNGTVPLCNMSSQQTGRPEGLRVGNINETPLEDLWRDPIFVQYREGHRRRDPGKTPICKGCYAQ